MSKRILVVDDDAMNLRMTEFTLKKNGYEVLKADSGRACLDVLETEKVDLILLDKEMPEMSGMETFCKIRENSALADIPVAFLTAATDEDSIKEALSAGAAGYVKKPFLPKDLIDSVEKLV